MTIQTQKPVVFLAFANDRDDRSRYLRNLPEEARRLRQTLERAERAGLCELEERANVTIKEVLDVFQTYRNRIAIFHFAGHANGYQLLLESSVGQAVAADAGGLAAFLGQQRGLQLVFLNGCSTQDQAAGLLEAKVATVIATSQAIDDHIAMDFADRFYQGLASGASIYTAYKEAEAAIQTAQGSSTRGAFRQAEASVEERWPWDLYPSETEAQATRWNLPEAVNDPLFGLPSLPVRDLPDTPFRHLNWFTKDQAEVFFGRGRQIRELYDGLTAQETAPILLLYGQAGVGKSSLLVAGLLPRLENSHEVRYLRREPGKGLLDMLQAALSQTLEDSKLSDTSILAGAWRAWEARSEKPLVIILDQVEEIFILPEEGHAHELADFLEVLQTIFADAGQRPQGKLILGFRKEWLAEIEGKLVERGLPHLKIFVERLDRAGIIEAVEGPARSERLQRQYGLTVEAGLAEIIADDLLEDRGSAIAPTLQILLSKMWDQAKARNEARPHFDRDLYQSLKKEGILLQDFLEQQIAAVRASHADDVDSGLVLDILAFHTTPLGAAQERSADQLPQVYSHRARVLPALIQACKSRYLLIDPSENQSERASASRLFHDALAPLVRKRFDESDKPGQRARRILESRVTEGADGQPQSKALLAEADLAIVEQGYLGMRAWTPAEQQLVEASRQRRDQRERSRRLWRRIGIAAVVLILLLAGVALWQWRVAQSNFATAETRREEAEAAQAAAVASEGTAEARRVEAEAARATAEISEANTQAALAAEEAARAEAEARRIEAENARSIAEGRLFVSIAQDLISETSRQQQLSNQDELSVLLARQAYRFNADYQGHLLAQVDEALRPILNDSYFNNILPRHDDEVTSVAFSANGQRLATGSKDGTVHLWDLTAPAVRRLARIEHDDEVTSVALSADGQKLATGSEDGSVHLWDVTHADPRLLDIIEHENDVTAVAFSPTEAILATGSEDDTVRLWDVSGTVVTLIEVLEHGDEVTSLAFSPDGQRLATGSQDRSVRLWDMNDPTNEPIQILTGYDGDITSVAFSPDGQRLATGSRDQIVRLWNVTAAITEPVQFLRGYRSSVILVAFSADGQTLATAGGDDRLQLWDVTTPEVKQIDTLEHDHTVTSIAFNSTTAMLATGGNDGDVWLWHATNADTQLTTLAEHQDRVVSVAFSPDGQLMATGSWDKTARLWDMTQLRPQLIRVLEGHEDWVTSVAFSPDGQTLATGSWDSTARLWPVSDANAPPQILPHADRVAAVTFSPDERTLATGSADGTVWLWDVTQAMTATAPIMAHQGRVTSVAFSPDGQMLASGGWDQVVRLWQVALPNITLTKVITHGNLISSLAFSPDGQMLATGSWDRTVRLWDVAGPMSQPAKIFDEHRDRVTSIAFSPDARLLATGSADRIVRLWDLADNPRAGFSALLGSKDIVESVAFSPDQHTLASGGGFSIFLWPSTGELVEAVCKTVRRNLTLDEWREFIGETIDYVPTCPNLPLPPDSN